MWSDIIDNDLEAPKDYARLKQQNAKLRNELKVINDCLSKQVERKKESHKTQQPEFRDETLKAELQNAQKQLKIKTKHIQILEQRQEQFENMMQYQSQIKQLEEQIKELQINNKVLQQINSKQEKKLVEVLEDEFIKQRINHLEEENKTLRTRVQSMQKTERALSHQPIKMEIPMKPIQLSQKQQEILNQKESIIQQLLVKQYEQEKHIKILNNLKDQYDKQISQLNNRIKHLESTLYQQQLQIQDKTIELNRKNYLLPNLSARNSKQIQKLNKSLDLNISMQLKSDMSEQKYFEDNVDNVKLHNIRLFWDEMNVIRGIQAIYLQSNTIINGGIHVQRQNLTEQFMELNSQDYIRSIKIGFKEQKLQYLELITNNNSILKFGECQQQELTELHKQEGFGSVSGLFKQQGIANLVFQ